MPITREHLLRYKSAVYLNNTAVAFMAHGEHEKSLETLSDALVLIKSLVQVVAESPLTAHKAEIFAQTKVQTTQQRLARLPTASSAPQHDVDLLIACFDGSLNANVWSLDEELDDDCDWYTGVAVVMDDVTMIDSEDVARCMQVIAPAIVLSNYALSYQYASRLVGDALECAKMVDSALRMLDIGQAVLGVKQRTMEVNEGNMFLALVLANNTCCVHQHDGSCRFYDALFRTSQELDLLKELSAEIAFLTRSLAPVAGAA